MRIFSVVSIIILVAPLAACIKKKSSNDKNPVIVPIPGGDPTMDQDNKATGYPNGYPWVNNDGTRNVRFGPHEYCGFLKYGPVFGITSNYNFNPDCSHAKFGYLDEVIMADWSVKLENHGSNWDDKETFPVNSIYFAYDGKDTRIPIKEGFTYSLENRSDTEGYFSTDVSVAAERDSLPNGGGAHVKVQHAEITVLHMPTARGEVLKMKFSVDALGNSGKTYHTSGNIELKMCNNPNETKDTCDVYWATDGKME